MVALLALGSNPVGWGLLGALAVVEGVRQGKNIYDDHKEKQRQEKFNSWLSFLEEKQKVGEMVLKWPDRKNLELLFGLEPDLNFEYELKLGHEHTGNWSKALKWVFKKYLKDD
ncbi:hypothetical protein SM033_00278 [Vibrio phage vB_VpaM_sm033]|nr:hypothetical protein SM033_00278 [Vibrio phage vB_VpaM_sm033]